MSNLLSTCPEEHLQSKISERKSWNLKDFWIILEVFGTMAENFFRVVKTAIDVQGKILLKNVFKREKIIISFQFWAIFYFKRKNSLELRNRNLRIRGNFLGKTSSGNLWNLSHFFGFWSKKSLVGIFFCVVTTAIRASRGTFLEKSKFFFKKKVLFVHLFWSLSNFFGFWQKKSWWQRNDLLTQKKLE